MKYYCKNCKTGITSQEYEGQPTGLGFTPRSMSNIAPPNNYFKHNKSLRL